MTRAAGGGGAVLHVVVAGEIGGAERMLLDLCTSSGPRKHTIALFTPNEELRALFHDAAIEVDDRGRHVKEGPLPFLASSLGRADVRWLAEVIERRDAAIVHLHTFASQVLGTRAAVLRTTTARRRRIVRTEHSTRVYDDPSCWPFSRWSLARADAVVCISDHVRRAALHRAPWASSKMRVIYNGVDTELHFIPNNKEKREEGDATTPRAAGSGSEPRAANESKRVRFVALGRLDARKGLDLALRAIAQVPQAELDVVGDGEERASLEDLVRELGVGERVRFRGFTKDVRSAIANADVVLSSARKEGLGIALLEAMSMERPVVGVPIGGVVEIVREGYTGWLADVRAADALARAMKRAIDVGPAERLRRGVEARKWVQTRFSLRAMQAGYEEVYAQLAVPA